MVKVNISGRGKLLDLLIEEGIPIPATCGGKGRCGHCRVRITGKIKKPNRIEKVLIPASLIKSGYRLACQYRVERGVRILLSRRANPGRIAGANGLALDLGTTMLKGAVVDLKKGGVVRRESVENPQISLGGDVLTRIDLALSGRYQQLRRLLFGGIDRLGQRLGIRKPLFTTVVGNPVMLSFFLNRSVKGLAGYPFQADVEGGLLARPPRYVFPIIGGFVGGDTIAGILATGLYRKRFGIYIDLGTNGEVALVKKGRIYAVSTAAGPAFEGSGLSWGCQAVPGAIDQVFYRNGLKYHTIGRKKPTGICASGYIDLLAVLLEEGHLSEDGRLRKRTVLAGFEITQADIRSLQLAIGAIHAGIETLLDHYQVSSKDIEMVVITGEFGSHLNPKSLKRVGILPRGIGSVEFEPDLPLKGAIQVLLDLERIEEVERIRRRSRQLELALQHGFQERFVKAMLLRPWD
ncbi:MAG TPA: DUF4445 domain-containing protein [bacterium (Candidatus Stahlbacteria)]|nr:DUF4445 domain-containing protein [Candidatus Stahlbacteria bacterium]